MIEARNASPVYSPSKLDVFLQRTASSEDFSRDRICLIVGVLVGKRGRKPLNHFPELSAHLPLHKVEQAAGKGRSLVQYSTRHLYVIIEETRVMRLASE